MQGAFDRHICTSTVPIVPSGVISYEDPQGRKFGVAMSPIEQ